MPDMWMANTIQIHSFQDHPVDNLSHRFRFYLCLNHDRILPGNYYSNYIDINLYYH